MVLLAVKAWQVPEAAQAMLPLIGEETGVVFLGNGVEATSQLSAVLGERHVLGGTLQYLRLYRRTGAHPACGHRTEGGVQRIRRATQLHAWSACARPSSAANVLVTVPEDIQAAIWEKFVFIAAVSGLGAITRAPFGVFRSLPETRQMLEQALEETVRVARARKINLPEDTGAKTLANIDKMGARHRGIHGARYPGRTAFGAGRSKRRGGTNGAGTGHPHPGACVYL